MCSTACRAARRGRPAGRCSLPFSRLTSAPNWFGIPFGVRQAAVEAVLRARQCRDARPASMPVDDRKIKRGVQVQPIEAAEGKLRFATKLPGRPFGDHLHGSADSVLAEQRPLRPAEHLDPIDVEQFEHRARGSGQVDAVDVDADARILGDDEIGLTDAADEHLGEVAAAAAHCRRTRTPCSASHWRHRAGPGCRARAGPRRSAPRSTSARPAGSPRAGAPSPSPLPRARRSSARCRRARGCRRRRA